MSHVLRSNLFRWIVLFVACATLTGTVFAQSTVTGAIAGTVLDPSKAVVVGAKVTVRNIETNQQATATTDAAGKFRLVQLTPGVYAISAQAEKFAVSKADSVIVEVGKVTELDIPLAIVGSAEKIEVTAEAPLVNTLQQDFSNNVNQTAINNLPINGRRWSNFALLTPGAGLGDSAGYGLISFRGISGLMNNSTVDGGDNNQAFFSEERGRTRTNYVMSQSAVQEFQVNTSNYSAEYGRAAGAVINTVTKSGTNTMHGEVFYYMRDNALGATNAFTTHYLTNPDGSFQTDASGKFITQTFKPTDRRQQFGGNLGGAIIKDKLFFFFNYDGQRQNIPGVAMPSQPSALFGPATTGVCTDTATTPASTLFSCPELTTMSKALYAGGSSKAQLASANAAGMSAINFLMATTGEQPRTNDQNIFFPKLDWRVNQNNTFTASYNRLRRLAPADYQTQPVVGYAVGDWGDDTVKVDSVNGRLSSMVTNKISNEMRFSFSRELNASVAGPQNSAYNPLIASATKLYQGLLPDVYFSAGGASYNIGLPYTLNRYAMPDEHRIQWANSTTVAHGRHMIKFGMDVTGTNDFMNNLFEAGGDYSYSSRTSFIIDYTNALAGKNSRNYSSYAQSLGSPKVELDTMEYAGFLQDDIRISRRLSVNLGMRYEYEQLPAPRYPNAALNSVLGFAATTQYPHDKNNYGPRVGFALDVFGDGKTSLRGGYGIYYGRLVNSTISSAITATGAIDPSTGLPLGQSTYSYKTTNGPLFPSIMSTAATTANVAFFAPNAQNPQIHQADLVLEREVAKNTVVSASYLMSLGREMTNFYDMNEMPPGASVTQTFMGGAFDGASIAVPIYTTLRNKNYGHMSEIIGNVNSSYNAMVLQVNRRMTNGLQFQVNYTWAHTLDSGQNTTTFTDNNDFYAPYATNLEYGNSNYDIRHRIVGNAVWQPQYFRQSGKTTKAMLDGWSLSPIVTVSSGAPFTEAINGYPFLPSGMSYAWSGSSLNESGGTARLAPLVSRNNWRLPWLQNIDMRLSRQFRLTERQRLEVIAEAFNLFNHMNVTKENNTIYNMCSSSTVPTCTATSVLNPALGTVAPNTWIANPLFGTPTSAANSLYRERQVQFALRYSF